MHRLRKLILTFVAKRDNTSFISSNNLLILLIKRNDISLYGFFIRLTIAMKNNDQSITANNHHNRQQKIKKTAIHKNGSFDNNALSKQ